MVSDAYDGHRRHMDPYFRGEGRNSVTCKKHGWVYQVDMEIVLLLYGS